MTVDVIISAGAVTHESVFHRTVAVIDVFRATSVIVEAIRNGARRVIPVMNIEEASELKNKFAATEVILGGERDMELIPGFDKDNSPLSYDRTSVEGKTVIFTTTNGTRAILGSRSAHALYVGSFLNLDAVCRRMADDGRDVVLVCAGREDSFTTEDGLCAGAMAGTLAGKYGFETTDIAEVMLRMYADAREDLHKRLSTTRHYRHMMQRGYDADIDFCLQHDLCDTIPCFDARGEIKQIEYDNTKRQPASE